jgi:acetyltransferase-like isoleucine patch superfamily enzyme
MNGISKYAVIKKTVSIAKDAIIGEFSIVGKNSIYIKKHSKTKIEKNCTIGSHVIIYEGTTIERDTQIEDFCRIGEKTLVGENCRLIYGTKIYGNVTIGNKCVIGGFICEDVIIGNCCRIFGELVHKHSNLDFSDIKKWDKGGSEAPLIGDNVFVGFGAKIIGGIKIGKGSYVWPGAIVTKDVPPNHNVKGINGCTPIKRVK